MSTSSHPTVENAHPPSPERSSVQQIGRAAEQLLEQRAHRTRFLDRVAMRIGLALLIWGARPARTSAPRRRRPRIDAYQAYRLRQEVERNEAHQLLMRSLLGGPLGR